jgi:hypothetical protein
MGTLKAGGRSDQSLPEVDFPWFLYVSSILQEFSGLKRGS